MHLKFTRLQVKSRFVAIIIIIISYSSRRHLWQLLLDKVAVNIFF